MHSIKLVEEFHTTFGNTIPDKPTMPTAEKVNFRIAFMQEELNELKEAFEKGDLVEYADALGDLQYVLDGAFIDAGLHTKKAEIMEEIHRSNMSKVCNSIDESIRTLDSLPECNIKTPIGYWAGYHSKLVGKYWIVIRVSDNKVMKSINYSKPNLYPIVYPF